MSEISPREKVYKENIRGYSENVLNMLLGRELSEQERTTILETSILAGTKAMESNAYNFDILGEADLGTKQKIMYALLGIGKPEVNEPATKARIYLPGDIIFSGPGKTVKYEKQ